MTVSRRTKSLRKRPCMMHDGENMDILAAYDQTGSMRATAELTGCSHHTVARHVAARSAGRPIAEPAPRPRVTDAYLPKIEEWVEASKGRIRADKAHEKLLALGYEGSERSTRRAIAQVKAAWRPAGFPTGKTFDAWDPTASSIPAPTQQALRTLE